MRGLAYRSISFRQAGGAAAYLAGPTDLLPSRRSVSFQTMLTANAPRQPSTAHSACGPVTSPLGSPLPLRSLNRRTFCKVCRGATVRLRRGNAETPEGRWRCPAKRLPVGGAQSGGEPIRECIYETAHLVLSRTCYAPLGPSRGRGGRFPGETTRGPGEAPLGTGP